MSPEAGVSNIEVGNGDLFPMNLMEGNLEELRNIRFVFHKGAATVLRIRNTRLM